MTRQREGFSVCRASTRSVRPGQGITSLGWGITECYYQTMQNEKTAVIACRVPIRFIDALRDMSEANNVPMASISGDMLMNAIAAAHLWGIGKYRGVERMPRPKKEKTKEYFIKVPIDDRIRWVVLERDNFTCKRCGSRKFLAVDHIIPESKGGATDSSNLQTLCRRCNSQKGGRMDG